MRETVTKYAIKKGDQYYVGPHNIMWGPIYEARLFNYVPNTKFVSDAKLVIIKVTYTEND